MTKVEEVKQVSEILPEKSGESSQDNEATLSATMAQKDQVIQSEHLSEIQGPLALNLSPTNVFFDHSKTVTKPSKEVTNESPPKKLRITVEKDESHLLPNDDDPEDSPLFCPPPTRKGRNKRKTTEQSIGTTDENEQKIDSK